MQQQEEISEESSKRDGCLSLFLAFYIFISGLGGGIAFMLMLLSYGLALGESSISVFALVAGLSILCVTSGIAAWHKKKWGVFGFAAVFVLGSLLHISFNHTPIFFVPMLQIILLGYLVKPKWHLFE